MEIPLAAMHRKNLERFSAWNANWNDSYNETRLDNRLFRPIVQVRYPLQECSKLIQTYTKRSMSDPKDALRDVTFTGPGEIRPSSLTEQLATGLCWDLDRSYNLYKSGKRRSGFPSWSWTGWLERLTAPTEYDGYISNTHRLRISVEDLNSDLVEWESYCQKVGDGDEFSRARPRLHVEGEFVEISLHDLTTDPSSPEEIFPSQCEH
ncbi:hypothetical protein QBC43DRAFT_357330 [Cladorrhinum sp. PSN259]|nr:hypothetical protein QBC43DRAFT_357330 [Cladorrhinum sp. PSN259]